jgi:hypothetical protein
MWINLGELPSVDQLGVKRWSYMLPGYRVLHVFERPRAYLTKGEARFMLRVLDVNERKHLRTEFAKSKPACIRLANAIAEERADV